MKIENIEKKYRARLAKLFADMYEETGGMLAAVVMEHLDDKPVEDGTQVESSLEFYYYEIEGAEA